MKVKQPKNYLFSYKLELHSLRKFL